MKSLKTLLFLTAMPTIATSVHAAGAYFFAGEINGTQLITHPIGYTGTQNHLLITIGIDPTSAFSFAMEVPAKNAVDTLNNMVVTTGNSVFNLAGTDVDFESTLLHEIGHSIGLDHPNAGTESGLTGLFQNFTRATDGVDDGIEFRNVNFNVDAGPDNIPGSFDDLRSNDINLLWYRIGVNNPSETPPAVIDRTTYTNDISFLPVGHTFAANPDRTVLNALGESSTEGVMQQGAFTGETQDTLHASDIVALRLARAGYDGIQGTADDYDVTLVYVGQTTAADIVLDFDNSESSFAVARNVGAIVDSNNARITSSNIYFNTGFNWRFGFTQKNTTPPVVNYINLLNPTPTTDDSFLFEVDFSEDVNLEPSDVTIVSTLPNGTSAPVVSTLNGKTWTVEVTANDGNDPGYVSIFINTDLRDAVYDPLPADSSPSASYRINPAGIDEWLRY